MMTRGEWLRVQMSQSSIRADELANMVGRHRQTIYEYRRGKMNISDELLTKFEKIFGTKSDLLITSSNANDHISARTTDSCVEQMSNKKLLHHKCEGYDCRNCVNTEDGNRKCQYGLEIIRRGLLD